MKSGRMFRHNFLRHRREAQPEDISDLPSIIGNPTVTLDSSIGATIATATADPTAPIATAAAPSGFTTITETDTLAQSITGQHTISTTVTTKTRTITDSSEYASITSAAALSSSTTDHATTSTTSSAAATSTAAAAKSSSNLNTLIPAIVVPIVGILLASLALFWFIMRRRARKELKSQPEFVMAGKGEKLSSRSNSGRSTTSDKWEHETKSPNTKESVLPSIQSPSITKSEWPPSQVGIASPVVPQEKTPAVSSAQSRSGPPSQGRPYINFNRPQPRPITSGRMGPTRDPTQDRERGYNNANQKGLPRPPSRSGPGPATRTDPSPIFRSGPSPVPQRPSPIKPPERRPSVSRPDTESAFRFRGPSPSMHHNARAQAPPRLGPPPGAYNGASSISQYSPIVKATPTVQRGPGPYKRGPPPPLQTSNNSYGQRMRSPQSASPAGTPLTEENLRIARLGNSSRLGRTAPEPSPSSTSPKLPPPATRSQLIPRDSPGGIPDNFYPGGFLSHSREVSKTRHAADRASIVSDPEEYEDIAAKSDVSSLNEFERFDFGPEARNRGGSGAAASMNYFAAHNSPAGSGGSPFGNGTTYERW
ncbi:hypothetical protein LTR10_019403 [Elasticomyces elasticus]|uniref:Uncharacterized protein n=1 Tax=Exophiala sideris TaxID=1016849 RepID=A0ABR0IVT9_9EURO|nr:hypothetical protein LTR10_019403 [Elasticomyces elasticus]KAK5021444.1 hypothetical protein LTS07_011054 [Exophiala sideris]KAK5025442.1 hypothetical protein LTR13_010519 [Exophiala sideris]KAK5049293.1 hypothetical protein LTR69_011078 [Exophiala sideris]KAK5176966.1 hypothetical protein LTR44_010539 [Eurotiomycetes sp. CCFEE 6388]